MRGTAPSTGRDLSEKWDHYVCSSRTNLIVILLVSPGLVGADSSLHNPNMQLINPTAWGHHFRRGRRVGLESVAPAFPKWIVRVNIDSTK